MKKRAIGTIYVDDEANGSVSLSVAFTSDDALFRADALRDIAYEIDLAYNRAVADMHEDWKKMREKAQRKDDIQPT